MANSFKAVFNEEEELPRIDRAYTNMFLTTVVGPSTINIVSPSSDIEKIMLESFVEKKSPLYKFVMGTIVPTKGVRTKTGWGAYHNAVVKNMINTVKEMASVYRLDALEALLRVVHTPAIRIRTLVGRKRKASPPCVRRSRP